jgi:hypothetical protein
MEKWNLCLADRRRDLEDELRSGRSKKPDLVDPVAELLCEKHSHHAGDA